MMMHLDWLPDAAWRGALLLAIAFVLARLLRSRPPAVRHVLWAGALAGVMAMPILSTVAPIRLSFSAPQRVLQFAAAELGTDAVLGAESARRAALDEPIALPNEAPSPGQPVPAVATADIATTAVSHSPVAHRAAPATDRLTPAAVAGGIWLLGALLLAVRLLAGFVALGKLRRRGLPVDDPDTLDLLSGCAARIGTHATPRLVASPVLAMPCTAGLVRPVVLLPDEYVEWSRERLEMVLLHELGHIRRMDIVPHLLAEVARVVYWFNPLVWIAASRLRAEAESATDDRVVRAGARPSDYADHLLDIVRQARKAWHPAPLIPLARRAEFEGRILAILDSGGRALPSVRWAAGVLLLVSGLSVGVASVGGASNAGVPRAGVAEAPAVFAVAALDEPAAVRVPAPAPPASAAEVAPAPNAAQGITQRAEREATVGALAEALRDPVASVRQAAVEALGTRRDSIAVRALIEVLRSDESASVRRSAAWALGELEDPAAIPVLSEALTRDRDAEVRKNAASALGNIDNPRATPALIQALERDAEVAVRIEAAEALANIEDQASIDALVRVLDRDDDPGVKRAVIDAIDNLEGAQAVPALSRALKDANVEVRRAAADALGSMDDRDAVPALVAAARDADAEVRRHVINSLSSLEDRRAIPVFVAALADADAEVRRDAAQGLGNLDNLRNAPPELIRAMDDRDAEVRHAVAHALGHTEDPAAIPALVAHVSDANVEVRRAVVDALTEFDDPAVEAALRTALKDSDPEVRESAAKGLGNRNRSR